MRKTVHAALAGVALCAAAAGAWAQSGAAGPPQAPNPLAVYQGFLAARAVAERCNALDPGLEPTFQANLALVADRAREALGRMLPPERQGEVPRIFANMGEAVRARVTAGVDGQGCEAEGPRRMVEQYRALAVARPSPGG